MHEAQNQKCNIIQLVVSPRSFIANAKTKYAKCSQRRLVCHHINDSFEKFFPGKKWHVLCLYDRFVPKNECPHFSSKTIAVLFKKSLTTVPSFFQNSFSSDCKRVFTNIIIIIYSIILVRFFLRCLRFESPQNSHYCI